MSNLNSLSDFPIYFLFFLFFNSCQGQETKTQSAEFPPIPDELVLDSNKDAQIAEFVVNIFEDSKGNIWFGTMSKGAARYDGKTLTYFTTEDGLANNSVVSFAEDKLGNIWMGTHNGLSKFDGKTFTTFTEQDGLCYFRVSNLYIDRSDNIWIGSWNGVCQYNNGIFFNFPLPSPNVEVPSYQETTNWVTEIMEDKDGNMWFGRSGYGASKYDGKTFTHFTKKDGLPSNCIQEITEDNQNNLWFASRVAERDHPDSDKRIGEGGLSRYDGKTFTNFTEEGLSKNDIYTIYKDNAEHIWVGATGIGLYRFKGDSFTVFKETDRPDLTSRFGVQSMLLDSNGTFWLGFSGGLFRLEGESIVNVTQGDLRK